MSTSLTESGTESNVFTFGERLSIVFIIQASSLSGLSVAILFAYKFFRSAARMFRTKSRRASEACDSSLFMTLMVGEGLRAVGKIMSAKWVAEATITAPTTFCTSQGMIQLIGTNLIDWSTLGITIQTFVVLVLQWNAPNHFAKYLSLGVWSIVALIVGVTIGVNGLGIIGPAGSWCWIIASRRKEQILGEYLWMWIITILTIIFYGMDALVIRGYVTIEKGGGLRWISRDRIHLELTQTGDEEEKETREMAVQLLFYPLVYFICVFPFSITRWMGFAGKNVPYQASAFTTCLFSLSGFLNVILFFKTRPHLITGGPVVDHEKTTEDPAPVPMYNGQRSNRERKLPVLNNEEELVLAVPGYSYHSRNDTKSHDQYPSDDFYRDSYTHSPAASSSRGRRQPLPEEHARRGSALDEDSDDGDQGYLPM